MTVGNVFEGTVNDIKNGTVTLGLANGQTVQARIAAGVQLAVGQAMFFQVKSNDGTTVEIRPYTNGNLNNPTLLKCTGCSRHSGRTKNDRYGQFHDGRADVHWQGKPYGYGTQYFCISGCGY